MRGSIHDDVVRLHDVHKSLDSFPGLFGLVLVLLGHHLSVLPFEKHGRHFAPTSSLRFLLLGCASELLRVEIFPLVLTRQTAKSQKSDKRTWFY